MSQPIYNPQIPYIGSVPYGRLQYGQMIRIQGQTMAAPTCFAINLQIGPSVNPRDNIAMHLSPVFTPPPRVVRNSLSGVQWGAEESHGGFPFVPGQPFEIIILVDRDVYKIAINGYHFAEFRHRVNPQSVSHLTMDGDVTVSAIIYEQQGQPGGVPPPSSSQPPPPYPSGASALPFPPGYGISGAPPPYPQPGASGSAYPSGYPHGPSSSYPHGQSSSYPHGSAPGPYPAQQSGGYYPTQAASGPCPGYSGAYPTAGYPGPMPSASGGVLGGIMGSKSHKGGITPGGVLGIGAAAVGGAMLSRAMMPKLKMKKMFKHKGGFFGKHKGWGHKGWGMGKSKGFGFGKFKGPKFGKWKHKW